MTSAALALALGLAAVPGPAITDLRVGNGGSPFAGDGALLATVSPNGDGFRDSAIVTFRLSEPSRLRVDVVRTDTIRANRPAEETIATVRRRLPAGPGRVVWTPPRATPPRTYILRLTLTDALGRTRAYGNYRPGPKLRIDAPVVRVQGIDAGFTQRSYAPGDPAVLSVASDASSLRFQVFAYGNQTHPTERDLKTSGLAMTPPLAVDWRAHRDSPSRLRVIRAGDWRSGLYFMRATAADGRSGYAPFVVRPKTLGTRRVAVVLATNTWQAYNFVDENGDGWGDSWYVSGSTRSVDLERPYLDFGLPFRFGDWDLTVISWLNTTGKEVDYLSDDDLAGVASGDELARDYDLIVFPGHEEYVTKRAYDVVERYRDLGGNLMFLAANNFFWKVRREGQQLSRVRLWRSVGRSEAGLVGVQYAASDYGAHQAGYRVSGAEPWAFAGTGLREGDVFGRYGIEIDARAPSSPAGIQLLASIPDLMGPGRSAEMTYYETPRGAKVFAAGTLNFTASIGDPTVAQLVENVWARLSRP